MHFLFSKAGDKSWGVGNSSDQPTRFKWISSSIGNGALYLTLRRLGATASIANGLSPSLA